VSFDNVCKLLAEKYPLDFARWLLPEEPREIKVLKTELSIEPIRADFLTFLVESRRDIIPCPSLLNLGVQLSLHPASDVLSFRFCSCEYNRGSFREWLEGF
jgi:hypothetical protein